MQFEYDQIGPVWSDAILKKIYRMKEAGSEVGDRDQDLQLLFNCIDLTSLESTDNLKKIDELSRKAIAYKNLGNKKGIAAVCVYPNLVSKIKERLKESNIRSASVAGAFPSGQAPQFLKVKEVEYAVAQGADEIDVVISRGKLLEEDYRGVFEDLIEYRKAAGSQVMKVILETGELNSTSRISRAAEIAVKAGADFIKTSTGKIPEGATDQSVYAILEVIRHHYLSTGTRVGIKASGGIRDSVSALGYFHLTRAVLGDSWLSPRFFRIGTSSLADRIAEMYAERNF